MPPKCATALSVPASADPIGNRHFWRCNLFTEKTMTARSDHNLLFGIIALQMDFVRREQLVAATSTWLTDKSRNIDEILVEQRALSEEEHQLLAPLVARHLENHGGNPSQSLAALSSIGSVAEELRSLGDESIGATLSMIARGSSIDALEEAVTDESGGSAPSRGAPGESTPLRFRVLRPHAKGGLGEVSVARDLELNRDVALKEIQSRFADDEASRLRFLLEAEVTGGLEHPGIVPVYGLGRYEDGRPFYAMRFIKGDSLQEAANRFHREVDETQPDFDSVDFRKLLGRFVDVCHAIEYAHSRGVLHRDLKPGNIMLGKYGETLVVDWGLARTQGSDHASSAADETLLRPVSASGVTPTVMGSAIGTPAFMPPEQAAGDLEKLGAASDVYSLGATLYYLLTGQAPVQGRDIVAVLKDVQAGNFPQPISIKRGVPKALDAVCRKAMALHVRDRYLSPLSLSEDIERFLADEAVSAFPEPLSKQAKRWVRKHQTLAASTAAVVLVSAIGLGVFSSVVGRKNAELVDLNAQITKKSNALQDSLEAVTTAENESTSLNDFLVNDLLGAADPDLNPYQERTSVVSLLERAAARISETDSLKQQPAVEASLRVAIGRTYFALGQWSQARSHLARAVDLRRNELGEDDPRTLEAIDSLLDVQIELEEFEVAMQAVLKLEASWARIKGKDASKQLLLVQLKRSRILMSLGDYAAAESIARAILRKSTEPDYAGDDDVQIRARQSVADVLSAQFKNPEEAMSLYEQNLHDLIDGGSEEHSHDVLTVRFRMIEHLIAQARLMEAEQLCSEILATRSTKTLPDDHPHTIMARLVLGNIEMSLGRLNEAANHLRVAHSQSVESLGEDHSTTWLARHILAMAAYQSIRQIPNRIAVVKRAEQLARANVAHCDRKNWTVGHSNTHQSQTDLGWALTINGLLSGNRDDQIKGKDVFAELYDSYHDQYGLEHTLTLGSGMHLIQARQMLIDSDQTLTEESREESLEEFQQFVAKLWKAAESMPKGWPVRPNLAQALGNVMIARERFAEAEPLLREYYRYCMTTTGVSIVDRKAGIDGLAKCLQSEGRETVLEESLLLKGGTVYRLNASCEGAFPLLIARVGLAAFASTEHFGEDEASLYLAPPNDLSISVSVILLGEESPDGACDLQVQEYSLFSEKSIHGTVSTDSEELLVSDLPFESSSVATKSGHLYQFEVVTSDFQPNIWIEDSEKKLVKWLVGASVPELEFAPGADGEFSVLVFPGQTGQSGNYALKVREYTILD
jgi:serine/threonine protein kinase